MERVQYTHRQGILRLQTFSVLTALNGLREGPKSTEDVIYCRELGLVITRPALQTGCERTSLIHEDFHTKTDAVQLPTSLSNFRLSFTEQMITPHQSGVEVDRTG